MTVPPNSIEITAPSKGKNVLKNASHVEIQEGGSVTIECLVTGGKPPAQIKWFRKSVELRAGIVFRDWYIQLTRLGDAISYDFG